MTAARQAADAALTRFEDELRRELVALWQRQEQVVLARLTGPKTRRDTRHYQPPPGIPYAATKALDPSKILDAGRWVAELLATMEEAVRRIFRAVYDQVLGDLGGQPPGAEQQAELDAAVKARAEKIAESVQGHADQVREVIRTADADGADMQQIAEQVREVYAHRDGWADLAATTHVVGVLNEASYRAAEQSGSATKQWLSSHDARVRASHRLADGQTQPIGEPFELRDPSTDVTGKLMYPGDPTAPPSLWLRCRCTTLFARPGRSTGYQPPAVPQKAVAWTPEGVAAQLEEKIAALRDRMTTPGRVPSVAEAADLAALRHTLVQVRGEAGQGAE